MAVITGAAGGIGQALVAASGEASYQVIATDRVPRPKGLPCAHYLPVNLAQAVTDEARAEEVFKRIKALLGPDGLHALVYNAAVQILGGADSLPR